MSEFKPLARQSEIVTQEFADEILIYDLRADKAFNLNETSALIWRMSTGRQTVSQIAEELSRKFNSEISEEFVWLALEKLSKEKLISNDSEIAGLFDKTSRREIIRRVGFATIVSLPIVSSLVAPIAVNAQSLSCPGSGVPGNSIGCNCSANGNCTSGCCATTPTGNACVAQPGTESPGSGCRGGCECASGNCPPAAPGNPRICV